MRLTFLNQFYIPDISPTAHLAASIAEHRVELGDEVTIITSNGGYVKIGNGADKEVLQNPRVIRIWTLQLGKGRKLFRILDYAAFYVGATFRLLTLRRQDAIVSLTTPPFIAVAAILHKLFHRRTQVVLWNMDCYPEIAERTGILRNNGVLSRLARAVNRWIFRRLDDLVSLDTAMQELLLAQYAPCRKMRTHIIPNWERADFFPAYAKPIYWQNADKLGLHDRFVVLYLGNTGYGHRFDTVLDAAQLLRDDPVIFLFLGGGSRWKEIEAMISEKNLRNVVMHGYVPKEETPSVMRSVHCALITLQDFALGVMSPSKLHSNLAMGLPVLYVGPKGSNVDDAIVQFGCGISVLHGEAQKLAEWVRQMALFPPKYTFLRNRARYAFDNAYCDMRTLPKFDAVLDAPRILPNAVQH